MNKKIHEGHNVKRFRELLGIKQDTLAAELGDDWNQKRVSLLEQKENIEQDLLEQVAQILKVPAEAIRNFDEEAAVNMISYSFTDCEASGNNNYQCDVDFHPEDKWLEAMKELGRAMDEIKRLNELVIKEKEDKMELYERLLKEVQGKH